jgi:uncharacterized membrane protein YbhN (UPF0104 family)
MAAAAPKLPRRRLGSVFASTTDHDRHRRPADVVLVVVGSLLVLGTALDVERPTRFLRSATDLAVSLPSWMATALGATLAFGAAYVVFLVVLAAAIPGHRSLLRDFATGAAATGLLATVLAHLALGDTPAVEALWSSGGQHFPELRIAFVTTLVLLSGPFVVRPVRRLGQVVLILGTLAGVALQLGDAGAITGAIGLGMAVAGGVHLAFGSPGGALATSQVRDLLTAHGLIATDLVPIGSRTGGPARFHLTDAEGHLLAAEVFGRDAADMQVAAKLWQLAWYRDAGPFIVGRLRQAEHQALMGLLATRAGAPVPELVLLVGSERGDALMVTRHVDGTAGINRWTSAQAAEAWRHLEAFHAVGIAHGSVDQAAFTVTPDGALQVSSFETANLEAEVAGRRSDRAALLALTASDLGVDAALDVTDSVLSPEELAHTAPLLQPAALSPSLRSRLKRSGLKLADLRAAAAERAGVAAPELVQLRRVTLRSALSTGATLFAVWLVVSLLADVDMAALAEVMRGSIWAWVAVALVVGQLARLGAAVSTLGASQHRLPLGPTYLLQLALTFINMAVPGSAARIASNMRFYQKQGAEGTEALSSGVLDSFGGFLVQIAILGVTLGLGVSSMSFSAAEVDPAFGGTKLLAAAGVALLVGAVVLVAVARLRNWIVTLLRHAVQSIRGLRSARRATMLFGGNLAAESLSAAAFGLCVLAMGYTLPFVDLITITVVVALFAGLMPVPGGIGVTEAALAGSLTLAGLPVGDALGAALLFRIVTFYLPPLWGFVALRWLTRHDYL